MTPKERATDLWGRFSNGEVMGHIQFEVAMEYAIREVEAETREACAQIAEEDCLRHGSSAVANLARSVGEGIAAQIRGIEEPE